MKSLWLYSLSFTSSQVAVSSQSSLNIGIATYIWLYHIKFLVPILTRISMNLLTNWSEQYHIKFLAIYTTGLSHKISRINTADDIQLSRANILHVCCVCIVASHGAPVAGESHIMCICGIFVHQLLGTTILTTQSISIPNSFGCGRSGVLMMPTLKCGISARLVVY